MSELSSEIYEAPQTIMRMLALSQSLLYTLTPDLRAQAEFPMADPSRLDWDFIPKSDRKGVPIAVLDRHQRTIAQTLIRSALSMKGYTKALDLKVYNKYTQQMRGALARLNDREFPPLVEQHVGLLPSEPRALPELIEEVTPR